MARERPFSYSRPLHRTTQTHTATVAHHPPLSPDHPPLSQNAQPPPRRTAAYVNRPRLGRDPAFSYAENIHRRRHCPIIPSNAHDFDAVDHGEEPSRHQVQYETAWTGPGPRRYIRVANRLPIQGATANPGIVWRGGGGHGRASAIGGGCCCVWRPC